MNLDELRIAIKASEMSYRQIGDKAGLTKQTVYMIASGRCKRPTYQTVESLIKVLK